LLINRKIGPFAFECQCTDDFLWFFQITLQILKFKEK